MTHPADTKQFSVMKIASARKKACHLFKQTTSLFAIGEEIWEVV